MRFRLGAGAGCAVMLCIFTSPAVAARPALIGVPSPTTPLTGHPPVGEPDATLPGRRPRGRVDARTRVVAELDARGAPTAVSAVQRLTIHGVGDYFFAIPAPLRDVLPGPGTQSEPGLRPGMVLWQGFSGGTRILSAQLLLDPAQVKSSLPMRVRLSRTGSLVMLEVANATSVSVSSFTAVAAPSETRSYLAALARYAAGGPAPYPYLNVKNVRRVRRTVAAPLHVTGALVFPDGRSVRLNLVLGAGRRSIRVESSSTALPKVELIARLIPFRAEPRDSPTFDDVMATALRLARTRQYRAFLVNPDTAGTSTTTYVFRTAASRKAAPARVPSESDSPLPEVLLGCALALTLIGGIVAWAHS